MITLFFLPRSFPNLLPDQKRCVRYSSIYRKPLTKSSMRGSFINASLLECPHTFVNGSKVSSQIENSMSRPMVPSPVRNGKIPRVYNPTLLGIQFDPGLTFAAHAEKIFDKIRPRLNIIRILSSHGWSLEKKCLFNIYNALVMSIVQYSMCVFPLMCDTLIQKFQVIQNRAIRSIMRLDFRTSQTTLNRVALLYGVEPVKIRLRELGTRYVQRGYVMGNPLILELFQSLVNWAPPVKAVTPMTSLGGLVLYNLWPVEPHDQDLES